MYEAVLRPIMRGTSMPQIETGGVETAPRKRFAPTLPNFLEFSEPPELFESSWMQKQLLQSADTKFRLLSFMAGRSMYAKC